MWTAEYVEEVMMAFYEPRMTIFIRLTLRELSCLALLFSDIYMLLFFRVCFS